MLINTNLSERMYKKILAFQKSELTSYYLYKKIADKQKDKHNKEMLTKISSEEKNHAETWRTYTNKHVKPSKIYIGIYMLLYYIFGFTFTVRLFEKNEEFSIKSYKLITEQIPKAKDIITEEQKHEEILMNMMDEERLKYVGSMVLGLNDALVELTGTIAGLTFALANTKIVALSGIITGISATLSMAASNYLAQKADNNKDALKSSIYTGMAYLVTVVLMVLPYLLLPDHMYFLAFIIMIIVVVSIILFFNYYISVARDEPFFKNFLTMTIISLGVAAISFIIGIAAKKLLGVDI